jgi:nucleoside-diphosphate-sugar epimerase
MNLFLTGASGFLGSHTAEELVRRGHKVFALVRKTSRTDHLQASNIELVEGSLPEGATGLRFVLERADAVVHIAGVMKGLSEEDFYKVNEEGTARLVEEVLSAAKIPKIFLHVSTIAVHNASRDGPDFCLPPEACHPSSTYGKSKLAGEKALTPLRGRMRVVILRPPVLYGPGDFELLPLFRAIAWRIAPLYGAGTNRLSACYGGDVARALADLAEKPLDSDEIFCLDDGKVHTWRSMAETIAGVMGKSPVYLKIPSFLFSAGARISLAAAHLTRRPHIFTPDKIREMRQPSWVCGFKKLEKRIGWRPDVSFEEGVRKTLKFYREEGRISVPS